MATLANWGSSSSAVVEDIEDAAEARPPPWPWVGLSAESWKNEHNDVIAVIIAMRKKEEEENVFFKAFLVVSSYEYLNIKACYWLTVIEMWQF